MRVRTAYSRADHIVIVGTGPAGLSAAEELRAREFHGQITMIGDEPPYDRTGLSKGILTGHHGGRLRCGLADAVREVDYALIARSPGPFAGRP